MLKDSNKWFVLLLLSSTLFLIVIDITVLYVALPELTYDLEATASDKMWIINAYPLIVAGALPTTGVLSDKIGHKLVFLIGLSIFCLASIFAAFSTSPLQLIIARGLLAIGAAISMPATLAIIKHVFSENKDRALAIGVWSAVASGGAALGPIIGGVLLSYFWWGSVFLINIPIAIFVIIFSLKKLPKTKKQKHKKIDLLSSLLIFTSVVGVIYSLSKVSEQIVSYTLISFLLIISLLLGYAFIKRQMSIKNPLIEIDIFKNQHIRAGLVLALISMIITSGVELLLAQRLQLVLDFSPLKSSMYILPIPVSSILFATLAGSLFVKYGINNLSLIGFLFIFSGVFILTIYYDSPSIIFTVLPLILIGAGLGIIFTTASSAILLNAKDSQTGMVASLEETTYETGSVLGVTIMAGLLNFVYAKTLNIPNNIIVSNEAHDSLDKAIALAEDLSDNDSYNLINAAKDAFDNGFISVMILTLLITSVCILVNILYRKKLAAHEYH